MKPWTWTKFQDWGFLVLGAVLFVTPWLFGTATNGASSWNAWIVGFFIAWMWLFAFSGPVLIARSASPFLHSCRPAYHSSYYVIVAGAWLFLSPWLLGFSAIGAATWSAWLIGILVIVLATSKLVELRREPAHAAAF